MESTTTLEQNELNAQTLRNPLQRQTTGTTAYYSISTAQPDDKSNMSTPTQTPKGKAAALPPAAEGSGTTHENEKVPEYDHTTENHGYPIDKKTAPALPPRAEVVDEKAAGTSTDIEAPPATAASPTSPNKAAVGTFADGAVLAVSLSRVFLEFSSRISSLPTTSAEPDHRSRCNPHVPNSHR